MNDVLFVLFRKGEGRILLMGDLHAKLGNNNPNFTNVNRKFHEKLEANKMVRYFCESSILTIINTLFKHKNILMCFWENPGQNRKYPRG